MKKKFLQGDKLRISIFWASIFLFFSWLTFSVFLMIWIVENLFSFDGSMNVSQLIAAIVYMVFFCAMQFYGMITWAILFIFCIKDSWKRFDFKFSISYLAMACFGFMYFPMIPVWILSLIYVFKLKKTEIKINNLYIENYSDYTVNLQTRRITALPFFAGIFNIWQITILFYSITNWNYFPSKESNMIIHIFWILLLIFFFFSTFLLIYVSTYFVFTDFFFKFKKRLLILSLIPFFNGFITYFYFHFLKRKIKKTEKDLE